MIFLTKQILLSLILLLAIVPQSSAQTQKANSDIGTLKVMSYNIRIASPPSKGWGYTDLAATAQAIQKEKPDLVALQEVDAFTDRSGKDINQAKKLAELTGMYYHFAKAVDRSNGDYGVGILSRFPIEKSESFRLHVRSTNPENEIRAVALITVKTNLGKMVFVSAHLDHLSDDERSYQITQLNKILLKYNRLPIILGADLNTTPDNAIIKNLGKYLEIPCLQCPLTFPADSPGKTLDYILLSHKAQKKYDKLSYKTVSETYASDHLPLVMVIKKK
ncbi:endonuclease/exonuclease/phosphatase family protein [Dyadobacter sp. CY312]|uniref:endonuclease/exonuclease/phosphatase family protein n=1 Tax=Dyadobacter sp. CY312 TaxID=2907303 RepID=UPI001F44C566|nr:endonuclease/exonuclease/phosphatase family protein [Dyadobacter sp. CY312]MCE7040389.1 endonuclease/exonuclease/phosphatase family protein [Dyadobacter sp. CY312]